MGVAVIFLRGLTLIMFLTFAINHVGGQKKIVYASIERPLVEDYNNKYLKYVNMTAIRYGRRSLVYYVNMVFETLITLDNKVKASFYFYEFLSNRYQRSFVEMHFKWCDLIHKDLFFGAAMKQRKLAQPCPYPPDVYELYNMTILPDAIPRGFPFTKGRIVCNITYIPTKEVFAWGHVDMELKTIKVKERKPKEKL